MTATETSEPRHMMPIVCMHGGHLARPPLGYDGCGRQMRAVAVEPGGGAGGAAERPADVAHLAHGLHQPHRGPGWAQSHRPGSPLPSPLPRIYLHFAETPVWTSQE